MNIREAWSRVGSRLKEKRIDMELSFPCVEAQGENQVVVDSREQLDYKGYLAPM